MYDLVRMQDGAATDKKIDRIMGNIKYVFHIVSTTIFVVAPTFVLPLCRVLSKWVAFSSHVTTITFHYATQYVIHIFPSQLKLNFRV